VANAVILRARLRRWPPTGAYVLCCIAVDRKYGQERAANASCIPCSNMMNQQSEAQDSIHCAQHTTSATERVLVMGRSNLSVT